MNLHYNRVAVGLGCVGQLKRRASVWSAEWQPEHVGVIGPAYGVAVGLESRAVARTELGEGDSVGPGQQSIGGVVAMSTLLGAWDRTISSIIRLHRLGDWGVGLEGAGIEQLTAQF